METNREISPASVENSPEAQLQKLENNRQTLVSVIEGLERSGN